VSTIIAFLIPKRYESTTRLMPPDAQSSSSLAIVAAMAGKGSVGLGSTWGDLLGLKSSGALFTDVLQSRTVQDRIIERFDLRKVYGDKYWQDARKDLAQYTAVSEDRKSGVLTITVTDRDPQRAARMAQAYAEELDRLVTEVSTSSARRERIFIEERLKSVKRDLDLASQQFSEYASQNTAVDITAQAKAMVEAAARLEGELIASQSELQGLEQIYTGNNVRVRSLRARVEELKRQLKKLGGQDPASPSTDAPESPQDFPSIRKLPLLGVKWTDLYRQTKIQEAVYELLTRQYEITKIQEVKEIPTVKVLDLANVPEKKASPHRLMLMILGALLAFSAGIVWVLGAAAWQQIDPQDTRKQLGEEVVGKLRKLWSRRPAALRAAPGAKSWWKARSNSSGELE
jgi:capsule polysaccharide export protein KpsE/RkpR